MTNPLPQPDSPAKQTCPDCGGLPGIYPEHRCPACHIKRQLQSDSLADQTQTNIGENVAHQERDIRNAQQSDPPAKTEFKDLEVKLRKLKTNISEIILARIADSLNMTVGEYGSVYDSEKHETMLNQIMREVIGQYQSNLQAELRAFAEAVRSEVIGKNEKHDNGSKMVNDPSLCMDCTNPDPRYCRNNHRAEQRQQLAAVAERFGVTNG